MDENSNDSFNSEDEKDVDFDKIRNDIIEEFLKEQNPDRPESQSNGQSSIGQNCSVDEITQLRDAFKSKIIRVSKNGSRITVAGEVSR